MPDGKKLKHIPNMMDNYKIRPAAKAADEKQLKQERKEAREAVQEFNAEWNKYRYKRPEIKLKICRYLRNPKTKNAAIFNQLTTPCIDAWIIQIINEGVRTGDEKKLSFLLDQALGKLPNTIGLEKDAADSWAALVRTLRDEPEPPRDIEIEK